jgi:hypothetical protein
VKPDRTPSQRGRHSRRKGANGERAAREPLAALTGVEWERSAAQSRTRGGQGLPDLVSLDDDGRNRRPGLHPEVKVGAAPSLWAALAQATEDAGEGAVPFVLARKDRGRWVLVVEVDRWRELCERLAGGGE